MTIPGPVDLDKSGNNYQSVRVYMGPTLGWVMRKPQKAQYITSAGSFNVDPGVQVVYVNFAGAVVVLLPDVAKWMQQQVQYAANGWEASIWIKDLGLAGTNAITVRPFGTQQIDRLAQDFTIIQDKYLLRLWPLNDLSGWIAG